MTHKTSPAYQEYASALLANRNYRQMSLAAKGLLHHIRLECWENGNVPSNHAQLSKIVGCDRDEVAALIAECMPFLQQINETLIAPALEEYRTRLDRVRKVRAEAGQKGGKNKAIARNLPEQKSSTVNQTKPNQTHAVNGAGNTSIPCADPAWLEGYGND